MAHTKGTTMTRQFGNRLLAALSEARPSEDDLAYERDDYKTSGWVDRVLDDADDRREG